MYELSTTEDHFFANVLFCFHPDLMMKIYLWGLFRKMQNTYIIHVCFGTNLMWNVHCFVLATTVLTWVGWSVEWGYIFLDVLKLHLNLPDSTYKSKYDVRTQSQTCCSCSSFSSLILSHAFHGIHNPRNPHPKSNSVPGIMSGKQNIQL